MRWWGSCLLVGVLGLATSAQADSPICNIEHIFGATNINAVTGHGRMSVAVSADGDLTVLSWPSPSYADQLAYITSNAYDARSLPRLGAKEGAGAFLGLLVERGDTTRELTWLRDTTTWSNTQDYGPDDGANVHTRHRSASLGLTVTVVDAVDPERDVLVRHVRVEREAGADVTAAWLVTYANLSPIPDTSRIPELPFVDWAFDGRNDFGAVWDAEAGAIVHFHPKDLRIYNDLFSVLDIGTVEWGPLGAQLEAGTPDAPTLAALAAGIDEAYSEGAYLALTTVPAPDQHQIGLDSTPFCDSGDELIDNLQALEELEFPVDPSIIDGLRCNREAPSISEAEGWTHLPEDALADVADGELSGSGLAAGEVNEALRTPLVFDTAGVAEASVVLAAAPDAAGLRATLSAVDAAGVPARSQAALDSFLAGVRLPESAPDAVRAVARRSLINIRVGTDAGSGAVVASIARQAPYGLDWPRDGAFFSVLLDVSGQHELVDRRAALYDEWQRKEPARPVPLIDVPPPPLPGGARSGNYPAGAWEMNYYADGMIGGTWRFEIDNAAFAIWMIVAHAGWVQSTDPETYLRRHWDAVVLGTELIANWRDAETGLHWPAQEDDHPEYTQTLHGAITVFGAIDIAARAARLLGEDAQAAAWEDRAAELRDAILTHLYDEEAMRFVKDPGATWGRGQHQSGSTAWLVWPMTLLPWDDERIGPQLEEDLAKITPQIRLETMGGQYFMKNTVSLAVARNDDPVIRPQLDELLPLLASHATPGTGHFGECMLVVEEDGVRRADQRVSNPHLWEGALFYLTAMAMEDPEALHRYDAVLPASQVPAPFTRVPPAGDAGAGADGGTDGGGTGGGCCSVAPGGSSGGGGAALVLSLLAVLVAIRRRSSR